MKDFRDLMLPNDIDYKRIYEQVCEVKRMLTSSLQKQRADG